MVGGFSVTWLGSGLKKRGEEERTWREEAMKGDGARARGQEKQQVLSNKGPMAGCKLE